MGRVIAEPKISALEKSVLFKNPRKRKKYCEKVEFNIR